MDNNEVATIYFVGKGPTMITEEYADYLYSNQIEVNDLKMCEYIGFFCRMPDVVKVTDWRTREIRFIAPDKDTDEYHYELIGTTTTPWEPVYGSVEYIYDGFASKGIESFTSKKQKTYTK